MLLTCACMCPYTAKYESHTVLLGRPLSGCAPLSLCSTRPTWGQPSLTLFSQCICPSAPKWISPPPSKAGCVKLALEDAGGCQEVATFSCPSVLFNLVWLCSSNAWPWFLCHESEGGIPELPNIKVKDLSGEEALKHAAVDQDYRDIYLSKTVPWLRYFKSVYKF